MGFKFTFYKEKWVYVDDNVTPSFLIDKNDFSSYCKWKQKLHSMLSLMQFTELQVKMD